MAENLKNQVVDLDTLTEKLPAWLRQNSFQESAGGWNRNWPSAGRGWMLRVFPDLDLPQVMVFSNPLRYGRPMATFSLPEGELPRVAGQLIKEIEREVSDHTRKRRMLALRESSEAPPPEPDFDPDSPASYIADFDWYTMLEKLGYWHRETATNPKTQYSPTYRKTIVLDSEARLYINVEQDELLPVVNIYIEARAEGDSVRIQEITISPIEVVDTVRKIEAITKNKEVWGISDFAKALFRHHFKGSPIPPLGQLRYMFGESVEPEDVDSPEFYYQELQRHEEVVNAFVIRGGAEMRRRWTVKHPYYEMVLSVGGTVGLGMPADIEYTVFLRPGSLGAWLVTARGEKIDVSDHDPREFDIGDSWEIQPGADTECEVIRIMRGLSQYQGPEDWDDEYDEDANSGDDADAVDESEEDPDDIGDFKAYAVDSANYNPVMALTSKDIRDIMRPLGFKISGLYKSRVHHGWTFNVVSFTGEALETFKLDPYALPDYVKTVLRQGIVTRLPILSGQTPYGINMDVFDEKITLHCWEDAGDASADPTDPSNWMLYVDILPTDWQKRGRGGKMSEGAEPVPSNDPIQPPVNTEEPVKELDDVDAPEAMMPRHKPSVYALYGRYGDGTKICFSTFLSLGEAVARAKERDLHGAYTEVWVEELEIDSLEDWDTPKTKACRYHGVKYVLGADYEPQRVSVGESAEDPDADIDPEAYATTTFDSVKFLEAAGWKFYDQQWAYHAKIFPLPHPYQLGDMVFTGVEVRLADNEDMFHTFHIGVYFVGDHDKQGVYGGELNPQLLKTSVWVGSSFRDPEYDANMSIRRFVTGVADVLYQIRWPKSSHAMLAASSKVQAALHAFVHELNGQATTPLREDCPLETVWVSALLVSRR